MINWKPIAEMTEEMKDGRELLFCFKGSTISTQAKYMKQTFNGELEEWWQYCDETLNDYCDPLELDEVSHYAEYNAPEELKWTQEEIDDIPRRVDNLIKLVNEIEWET